MEINHEILAGILTGTIVGVILLILFLKLTKKDGSVKCKFDERQELIRGRGFKYGFFTLIIYDLCVTFLKDVLSLNQYADTALLSLIGILIAICVYVSYCIWNEGYFSVNENPKKVLISFAVVALFNFFIGYMQIIDKGIFENGVLTYRCINLLIGFLFLIIFAELFLKKVIIKSDEEE